jgi:tetratricopeptide (TPR) repeat protein
MDHQQQRDIRHRIAGFADAERTLLFRMMLLAPLAPSEFAALPVTLRGKTLFVAGPSGWAPKPEIQVLLQAAFAELPLTDQRELATAVLQEAKNRLVAALPDQRQARAAAYVRCCETLAEILVQQEPAALAAIVADVPLNQLPEPGQRQLLRYYQGLGAGLRDDFTTARTIFDELLALPVLDSGVRARTLNSDALFAQIQGNYERALRGFRASQALWKALGDQSRQARALLNSGILSYELHDYPAAESAFRESAALFARLNDRHRRALADLELGLLYRDQGRWANSLQHSGQAFATFEAAGAYEFAGRVANNIGEVEMLCGQYAAAATRFAQAGRLMQNRVYAVDVALNQGLLAQAGGDDRAALKHYQRALELAETIERQDIVPLLHYRIAHAHRRLGNLAAAGSSYAAAVTAIEASREPLREESLLISLMGRWQQVYEAAILICLEQGAAATAFDYAERARARAFADMLARRTRASTQPAVEPVDARRVQAALPAGTLLLAYFCCGLPGPESALREAMPPAAADLRACLEVPARLLVFAVQQGGLQAYDCGIDPNSLQSSAAGGDGRRFLRPRVLQRLYNVLLAPCTAELAASDELIIVPHGPLHQVPFAALGSESEQCPPANLARLSYSPSATVLLSAPPITDAAQAPCLALGYDGATGYELRHTEDEAAAIAARLGGEAWRGSPGIIERFRAAAAGYRIIHLACHGEFNLAEPLDSLLELGPGEHLRALDVIADLRLRAELVTLSACRSGLSRVLRGDEPLGLARAFMQAGTRAVLVTLWPVDDRAARLLMALFYAQLGSTGDPAVALQQARRELCRLAAQHATELLGEPIDAAGEPPFAAPEHWAGYVIVESGRKAGGTNDRTQNQSQ